MRRRRRSGLVRQLAPFRKLLTLPPDELVDFCRALRLLRRARAEVLAGHGGLSRERGTPRSTGARLSNLEVERISARATQAVSRAGRYAPFDSTCLMRAVFSRVCS